MPPSGRRRCARWRRAARTLLIPGHGMPIVGAERVRQALTDTAEWLETLVSQTLALMNAGATLEEVLRSVKPPARLAERRYLQPVYDEPDYVVRNLWRLYGGWYDGVPSHLKPAPEAELGREILALAGGLDGLIARARALAAVGRLALAGAPDRLGGRGRAGPPRGARGPGRDLRAARGGGPRAHDPRHLLRHRPRIRR